MHKPNTVGCLPRHTLWSNPVLVQGAANLFRLIRWTRTKGYTYVGNLRLTCDPCQRQDAHAQS
jgi:hypothetical protein